MGTAKRRALLSRIGGGGAARIETVPSIVAHLEQLLNTRQGDAPCALLYGVADFSDLVHGFPSSIQLLLKSIRATVLEFEPRLKNVTVRHVPDEDGLLLRLEISAQLAQPGSAKTLRLATTMRPGGRIDIAN